MYSWKHVYSPQPSIQYRLPVTKAQCSPSRCERSKASIGEISPNCCFDLKFSVPIL